MPFFSQPHATRQISFLANLRKICLLVSSTLLCSCAGVEFHAWEGQQQKWPTAPVHSGGLVLLAPGHCGNCGC